MVDQLRANLAQAPSNADNWVLLGRTLANLQRWDQARDAFGHAVALLPNDPAVHAQLGEVMTLAAGGTVSAAAQAEFARAPDDPRSRFYRAVAVAQAGDTDTALAQLRALEAQAPAEAPWRQLVHDEIQTLTAAAGPDSMASVKKFLATPEADAAPPAAGVPIADLQAAVDAHPSDAKQWLALCRAYRAAGDLSRATAAMRRANQAVPGNEDLLLALADLLADHLHSDTMPPEFLAVMQQVNAIDPAQPDALWYLGLDAANRGDTHRARQIWGRLADALPAASSERRDVERHLDGLR